MFDVLSYALECLRRMASWAPPVSPVSMGVVVLLLASLAALGQPQAKWNADAVGEKAQVRAVWHSDQVRVGGQNILAVVIDVVPKWHITSDEAQAVGGGGFRPFFTSVAVKTKDARLTFGPAQFPKASRLSVKGLPNPIAVFDGRVVVYLPVKIAGDAELGVVDVSVEVKYQACDDTRCEFPKTAKASATLTLISAPGLAPTPGFTPEVESGLESGTGSASLFSDFDPSGFAVIGGDAPTGMGWVGTGGAVGGTSKVVDFYLFKVDPSGAVGFVLLLVLAAVGGALLNFTPCVLPVIPIKVLSLAQTAGNRRRTLALGVAMALGVAGFWLALGVAIAGVSGFTAANQLFLYPWFSIGVGAVIAVLAVGMCGLFSVRLPNWVYAINPKHDSYFGSFGFGVMTAVLSTPCTAPMMGASAAWAARQQPMLTLATFTAIGLGMALPYLILSANPKLVDRLPRSGPGSELLKQVMGLLMLAAAAFFVGSGVVGMIGDGTREVFQGQWWVVGAFIAVAGVWLMVRVFWATGSPIKRGVFVLLGLVTVAAAGMGAGSLSARSTVIDWVYYTPDRFEQALEQGNVVLLDFTAAWCPNCHALERAVLNSKTVAGALAQAGHVAMKVDLTSGYPDGKRMLKDTGAVMIPWLVIFAPDGQAVFKADWYTASQITDALDRAKQGTAAPGG